ncbi:MAG TPA: aconitase family protein [Polyangiaceae bacterium]|jgi:aconitate hydratase|nr:aconitase family protein [Polyangiaceae bacterium]
MAQKILSARSGDSLSLGSLGAPGTQADGWVRADVDQIVLARAPGRALAAALTAGLKKPSAEVAIAYETRCIATRPARGGDEASRVSASDMLAHGILVARAGVGFPAPVHVERFASPARLCITDDPRLASVGGIGMLALVVPTASLGQALAHGTVLVRPPVSVQVLLTGRLRPFVCARDVALELVRRGLGEVVRRVEEARGAPVVLEFAGPSARLLSVGERGVMAALAPQVGAAAALFTSDERTEVFLRDQRRSKAHRALAPDAGAPCEEVVNVDLGAVDPLLIDDAGQVRIVRDLAGQPVSQALLGGDGGATLRDLVAAATLLKSKRVPPRLDFLLATPSRQMLEVLASTGALTDLIATGARLVEPDARVVSGEMYAPPAYGVAMRTCDPEPHVPGRRSPIVASAETLAYAIATGEVGDPRTFKRPVRVTVPRALPTDDVLIARKAPRSEGHARGAKKEEAAVPVPPPSAPAWTAAQTLTLVEGVTLALPESTADDSKVDTKKSRVAVLCSSLDEVREIAGHALELAPHVGAVLATYIPSALVTLLSAAGIAAIRLEPAAVKGLKGQKTLALPAPSQWPERGAATIAVGPAKLPLTWLALGAERAWATGGTADAGVPAAAARDGGRLRSSEGR